MVVGDPHAQPRRIGGGDAFHAGDAIVHRDQDVGVLAADGQRDDFRGQAIAVFKTVGHQIIDGGAKGAQRAIADRAGGGAVGIIVGDDEEFLALRDGIGRQRGHAFDVG